MKYIKKNNSIQVNPSCHRISFERVERDSFARYVPFHDELNQRFHLYVNWFRFRTVIHREFEEWDKQVEVVSDELNEIIFFPKRKRILLSNTSYIIWKCSIKSLINSIHGKFHYIAGRWLNNKINRLSFNLQSENKDLIYLKKHEEKESTRALNFSFDFNRFKSKYNNRPNRLCTKPSSWTRRLILFKYSVITGKVW